MKKWFFMVLLCSSLSQTFAVYDETSPTSANLVEWRIHDGYFDKDMEQIFNLNEEEVFELVQEKPFSLARSDVCFKYRVDGGGMHQYCCDYCGYELGLCFSPFEDTHGND